MNSYEVLLGEICSNINVVEAELFNATGLLGVYKEGKGIIIDKNMETDLKKQPWWKNICIVNILLAYFGSN